MKYTTKKLQLLFLLPFIYAPVHSTAQIELDNEQIQIPTKVKKKARGFMQSLKTRSAFVRGREEIKKHSVSQWLCSWYRSY